ncbi:MAG: DUF3618 domain-containing protein [Geminicoccaceae bacterium]
MAHHSTDPGGRSAAALEREVDAERAKVSRTIDALQSKMSIGHVVDQVTEAVGAHGGDVARNLGRQMRDNPLPLLLTGIGLAWLMAGSGPRSPDLDYDPDEDLDEGDDLYAAPSYPRRTVTGTERPLGARPFDSGVSSHGSDPLRPHEYAGEETHGIADTVRDAAGKVQDKASGLAEAAGDFGRRVSGTLGDTASSISDRVGGGADAARRTAAHVGHAAARRGRHAQEGITRMMEEQPLVFGALALAIGAAVGGALPRTRTEDEWVGAQSDRLKDAAGSMVKEEGRKLQATAAAVVDEAEKIADETAAEVDRRTPDGRTIVDRVEDRLTGAAGRLADRAKDEAERQQLGAPTTPDRK